MSTGDPKRVLCRKERKGKITLSSKVQPEVQLHCNMKSGFEILRKLREGRFANATALPTGMAGRLARSTTCIGTQSEVQLELLT